MVLMTAVEKVTRSSYIVPILSGTFALDSIGVVMEVVLVEAGGRGGTALSQANTASEETVDVCSHSATKVEDRVVLLVLQVPTGMEMVPS